MTRRANTPDVTRAPFLGPGTEVRITIDGRTWLTLEGVRVQRYFTKGGEVYHLTPINPAAIP